MNYFRIFLFLFSFVIVNSGICQTANITQGCVPLTVNFTGPNVTSYYWDFKDGSTSNLKNPSNIFTKAGTYNVTFQQTSNGPVVGTIQIKVYPSPSLSVTASTGCAPVNVTLNSTSTIDPAVSVSNYTWVFGDGQTAQSTATTISHTYASSGSYNVSLNIHTNFPSCDKTQIIDSAVKLLTPPVAAFTINPTIPVTCKDTLNVTFTDATTHTQTVTYAWNFGNGKTSTAQNPATQKYISNTSAKVFTALLTTSYKGIVGCTTSTSKDIGVGRPPIVLKASSDTICIYDQVIVWTPGIPGSYSWGIDSATNSYIVDPDFDPSDPDDTTVTEDMNWTVEPNPNSHDSLRLGFDTPGLHTITLTVTTPDGNCVDTKSIQVYVDEVTAAITPPGLEITCQSPAGITYSSNTNQSVSNLLYKWHVHRITPPSYNGLLLPDDSIFNVNTINLVYTSDLDSVYYSKNTLEVYETDLTITSKITGCHASDTVFADMRLPNAQFKTNITQGCKPLAVTFIDSSSVDSFIWPTSPATNSITSWKWVFDDGTDTTTFSRIPFQHTYADTGIYHPYVIINTAKGCADTSYFIEIKVGIPLSTVDFTSSKTSVCPGEAIQLSVVNPSPLVNAYHFVTDGNKVFHCGDDQTATWAYKDVTGPQDVSLMLDYNGCISTVTKSNYITVNGAVAKIDYFALCNTPMDYNFTSESLNATGVTWDFGDPASLALNTSTNVAQTHTYATPGDYTVKLTATGGCPSTTDSVLIQVRNVTAAMNISNKLCINSPYIFDASPSGGIEPLSQCDYSYTWQFPDLPNMRPLTTYNSSTSFTFVNNGIHTVKLIVKDVNGCRDTATATIKIYQINPVTPFVNKTNICTPTQVVLKDNSTGDTTLVLWDWNFGDGVNSVLSNQNSFTHTFTNPPISGSSYDVKLVITDALGCKTINPPNPPNPPNNPVPDVFISYYKPVSSIVGTPKFNMCLGDSIRLTAPDYTAAGSNLSYVWDLGNGTGSTLDTIPYFKYPAGNFPVKLVYTEISSGCKDSTSQLITVQHYPKAEITTKDPSTNLNVDSTFIFCAPQQLTFTDAASTSVDGVTTRSWLFPNHSLYTQTPPSVLNFQDTVGGTFTYNKGSYEVMLVEETSNGCADTTYRKFDALKALGTFSVTPKQLCRYDTITVKLNNDTVNVSSYKWFFEGVEKDTASPVKFAANSNHHGYTMVKLELFEKQCANTVTDSVYIYEIVADFDRMSDPNDIDTAICLLPSQPYTFSNTSYTNPAGAFTYSWDFGDSTTSTDYNPVHTYKTSGIYDVTLAVNNATCKDTIRKFAVINPNPKVKGIGDTACAGNQVHLQVDSPSATSSYLWSPGTGLADSAATSIAVTLPHTFGYLLKETDINGCTDSTLVNGVVIEGAPFPSNWDTTIVMGDYATLPVYGRPVYNYSWTPTDSLSCLNCDYPKANPVKDITYLLTVTDIRNCFNPPPFTYKVFVHPETFIKMPTAFSPNADGTNDVLYVKGWGIKSLKTFQIFNRWGQLIYSSNDIDQGWDGKYNGTLQNEDVYVYKVTGIDWKNQEMHLEGYVNLLH